MAPEILRNLEPTFAADYWSYGVLVYAMIFGEIPFFDSNPDVVYQNILSGKYHFPADTSKDIKIFLEKLLRIDPNERCSDFEELKSCAFFNGIDFNKLEK